MIQIRDRQMTGKLSLKYYADIRILFITDLFDYN